MNPGQTPAIEFRNVSISFDDVQALQNISFTLPRGGMLCVTGDSDSGKSVLLRLALGFLRPDEGEIWINGRETTAMGMVFQDNSFFSGRTVYENTAYRLDDRDWPEDEIERAVVEVLTFVGLEDEQEKQAEDLSGGMKRRLELARALVGWPSIMLVDERRETVGVLRLIGLPARRILLQVLIEGILVAGVGAVFGLALAFMWSRSPVMSPAFRSACSKKAGSHSSGVRRTSRKVRCPRFNICFIR